MKKNNNKKEMWVCDFDCGIKKVQGMSLVIFTTTKTAFSDGLDLWQSQNHHKK